MQESKLWIIVIIIAIIVVSGIALSGCMPPAAAQCDAEYYQCSVSESKICVIGSGPPAGCEFVGTGQSDCNLVIDC